jgi:hypothetical protein
MEAALSTINIGNLDELGSQFGGTFAVPLNIPLPFF